MTAHIISIRGNKDSESSARACIDSHKEVGNTFPIQRFDVVTPATSGQILKDLGISWDFPDEGERKCPHTGLLLHAYKNRGGDPAPRIACFASHAELWFHCAAGSEPIIVLEDDAVWVQKLGDPEWRMGGGWGMVGLNDPRGATRRAGIYHGACLNAGPDRLIPVPQVDSLEIPQGLAGHSAYILTPWAAKLLLEEARTIGGRPNDCLACMQRFPWLGQSTPYFTRVSGRPSTLAH